VKGIELMILLIVFEIFGQPYRGAITYILITVSMWFMVGAWLFAPFLFNPCGFEWQKIVDDWADWNKWISNRGGIGVAPEKSWESWWDKEQGHLRHSGKPGTILEILLALRFFIYQYGLVYHLNITKQYKQSVLVMFLYLVYSRCLNLYHAYAVSLINAVSFQVYGFSWVVIMAMLLVMKVI
jgi:callose synthase